MNIDIVSDVVCPWCYIGKRNLEAAIARTGASVQLRFRPYQLDPTIPPEGVDRKAYMAAKFPDASRRQAIMDALEDAGRAVGIPFALERIDRSPNTLDAHVLIDMAQETGKDAALADAFFDAYFCQGTDLTDRAALIALAKAIGLDGAQVMARLDDPQARANVTAAIDAARRMGVTGVPTFILDGKYAIVGAQPAEVLADALRQVAAGA